MFKVILVASESCAGSERVTLFGRLVNWEKYKYDHLEGAIAALLKGPSAFVRSRPSSAMRHDAAFALARPSSRATREGSRQDPPRACKGPTRGHRLAVQEQCYEQFLRIAAPTRTVSFSDEFDRDRDVDWTLVQPYLKT